MATSGLIQPVVDNFYTPENKGYYKQRDFARLERTKSCQQFRLLEIEPHQIFKSGTLSGKLLQPLDLAEYSGQYSTISYWAGDPNETIPFIIDGVKFNAFANLGKILMEACGLWSTQTRSDVKQLVWVDQMCINQSDPLERSHQVGLMRSIYEHAGECIVALLSRNNRARSLGWLKELIDDGQKEANNIFLLLRQASDDDEFLVGWLGVYDLLSHPWWRRAWVQQEFFVSRHVRFVEHRSLTSLYWSELLRAVKKFKSLVEGVVNVRTHKALENASDQRLISTRNKLGSKYMANQDNILWALEMMAAKSTAGAKKYSFQKDLKYILLSAHRYQSTDPRDRIYSLLGLTPIDYSVVPNYGPDNGLENVLIDVAISIIQVDQHMDILIYAAALAGSTARIVPSWTPDWTCTNNDKKISTWLFHEIHQLKRPEGLWKCLQFPKPMLPNSISACRKELIVLACPCNLTKVGRRNMREDMGLKLEEGTDIWFIRGCVIPVLLNRHQDDRRIVYSLFSLGAKFLKWFQTTAHGNNTVRFWGYTKEPIRRGLIFQEITLI
jgi:heterokaryon incompatibility protein (HET)